MNKYLTVAVFFLMIIPFFGFVNSEDGGELKIKVENIQEDKGTIWVGVYQSRTSFLNKEKAIIEGVKVHHNGSCYIRIPKLPYGTYAVALFQDINENGEMDRNMIGIPSEPYAFSKVPPSKWRLPRFDEVKFRFSYSHQLLRMRLERWWE